MPAPAHGASLCVPKLFLARRHTRLRVATEFGFDYNQLGECDEPCRPYQRRKSGNHAEQRQQPVLSAHPAFALKMKMKPFLENDATGWLCTRKKRKKTI